MRTGTIALPGGVPDGLTYEVRSAVPPAVTERAAARRRRSRTIDRSKELELLPPPVRNLAADLVEGRDAGWDQMAAIRDEFVNQRLLRRDARHAARPLLRPHRHDAHRPDPHRRVRGAVRRRRRRDGRRSPGCRSGWSSATRSPRRLAQRQGRCHRERHLGMGRARRRRRSGGSPSTSRRTARARPTPRPRAPRPSRWPSPTRRRLPRRHRTSSRRARRSARSTSRRSTRSPTLGATGAGWPVWAVVTTAVDRRCRSLLVLAFVAVVVGWKALRRRRRRTRPTTTGSHRRRVGRGDRPLHRGRRAAAHRRHAARADRRVRRRGRARPTSSPTCGDSPPRSTGPRTRRRRRPTSTPPRRGAAATRSPPSC